ncbi:MAG: T9SS type A sorting domain-containing protein [Bacteroidota bacterium]
MKKHYSLLGIIAAMALTTTSFAQWQTKSLSHQGNTRQYRVYQSPNYNASNPASMVITLHGLGDNMTNFSGIGMNVIADTANIIVVVPQAFTDPFAGTAWNAGVGYMGYFPNSTIDDVDFINTMIDSVEANYAINPNRVYACGFSMGGFMTNRLAMELNERITAFASVSGTFGFGLPSYVPDNNVSIVHFHGTVDGTVPFAGNASGISADSLVNFWVSNDQCDITPQHIVIPDSQSDGYTVDHYIYSNGQENSEVEFFKVTGADHVWLGPSNDISYTPEIWKFFNKHQVLLTAGIKEANETGLFTVYPNPASDQLNIVCTDANQQALVSLTDLTGKMIVSTPIQFTDGHASLSLSGLNTTAGIYLLKVKTGNQESIQRVIIE